MPLQLILKISSADVTPRNPVALSESGNTRPPSVRSHAHYIDEMLTIRPEPAPSLGPNNARGVRSSIRSRILDKSNDIWLHGVMALMSAVTPFPSSVDL